MKTIKYCTLLLLIALSGCTKKNPSQTSHPESFATIDVSIFNGWNSFLSIKVNHDCEAFLLIDKKDKKEYYYSFSISNEQHDSLSNIVNRILSEKLDSIYSENCADCGAYSVVIRNDNVVLKTQVDNLNNNILELNEINSLIFYLKAIASTNQKKQVNKVIFESRIAGFYPAPPPPKDGISE